MIASARSSVASLLLRQAIKVVTRQWRQTFRSEFRNLIPEDVGDTLVVLLSWTGSFSPAEGNDGTNARRKQMVGMTPPKLMFIEVSSTVRYYFEY